jgi:hypothetical protein
MDDNRMPWWERFFSGDNGLIWESLESHDDPWATHVIPWVDLARNSNTSIPVVLPRLNSEGQPSWYCGGRSTRGALQLRESLQAFFGPSYSDFDGRSYTLDTADPVEAAFAECVVGAVYKIHATKPNHVPRIQRAMELYRGLLERMPAEQPHLKSPLRVLRAELDRALAVGDEHSARKLFERIRSIGRLDAENLLYIDVEMKAGLGNWEDIAWDNLLLSKLTGLRLPKRVLNHVHEALYRIHVEPSEDSANPAAAVDAFRAAKLYKWSALFGTRRGLKGPRLLKAFFLYELVREKADHSGLERLFGELKQIGEPFVESLLTLLPPSGSEAATESPLIAADEAFFNCELDRALDLYLQAPPSPKRWAQLIRCAEEINTSEAARQVIEAVDSYGASKIPNSLEERLASLKECCSKELNNVVPDGLLDWARKVQDGMSPDKAMSILRENASTWDVQDFANQKDQVEEFADIVNNADSSSDLVFREATPLIYQNLIPESGNPSRFIKSLLQLFVTKVALFDDPSQNELELAREIVETLLTIGLDERGYINLITDVEDLIGSQLSPYMLPWSLDISELLVLQRCPNTESRLRLVLRVIGDAKRMSHRLHQSDILVLKQLCKDLDIQFPAEIAKKADSNDTDFDRWLSGKKIAIYTLVEPAGQRAAEFLRQLCPTVLVELNCDHECTQGLINLARNADLFVFAWKCSKHQAFYCIKKHRKIENSLIQPKGKGASSILRSILEEG